ncbi:MAG: cytochrome P450 [Meiothermus sp.]|uniref:cytochrome P450 n=1 Tax=Meiothermus sp. TaxID=1955249 RepID=UPI0025E4B824|nr:cytochrome P450 [Meiothermus sp.]MCS7068101.1 cytochrome P450 [Meiothermus sp.]MDW8425598.1 cytochrome P450 [Meiothermus sp.]
MRALPQPKGYPWGSFAHLPRWAAEPLALLEEGAALGPVFGLGLGRRAVVGYSPEWNKRLLSDLQTFRSRGSFSSLTPYLNGGIITTDAPAHRPQRQELNPHFHAKALAGLEGRIRAALEEIRPSGDFEANAWASQVAQRSLNLAYFEGRFPRAELAHFLAPLKQPFPAPLLPRPLLFARVRRRIAELQAAGLGLAAHLPAEEVLIGLAAGYDTTAHTLAWALWHAACYPAWHHPAGHPFLIKETLRLYPPGFIGSRRVARGLMLEGHFIPQGALALYSPYLTHRHPDLWARPLTFDPSRFQGRIPAWGYLPFGGGERICLGMHFAQMVLGIALSLFRHLEPLRGDPAPKPGLTLAPAGELWLRSSA